MRKPIIDLSNKEKYIFLLLGCYFLGQQINNVFFKEDYVLVHWFDYVSFYGIAFLYMLFAFIYWDKLKAYFEKKGE